MRRRGYGGWMASSTAAVILSLVFLVVEKHITMPAAPMASDDSELVAAHKAAPMEESELTVNSITDGLELPQPMPSEPEKPGILLSIDPALTTIVKETFTDADTAKVERSEIDDAAESTAQLIHRPPEPVASVTLFEPIAEDEINELPLHSESKSIGYLMDSMDKAFDRPTKTVSADKGVIEPPTSAREAIVQRPAPALLQPKLPVPTKLIATFKSIAEGFESASKNIDAGRSGGSFHEQGGLYVGVPGTDARSSRISPEVHASLGEWIAESQRILHRVVYDLGLEHPQSSAEIERLRELAKDASTIAESMTDFELAASILRLGYSVQRRADLWIALKGCLNETSIALSTPRSEERTRERLRKALNEVTAHLGQTQDGIAWSNFLLLEELRSWVESDDTSSDASIVAKVLERMRWPEMSAPQRAMLSKREFQNLEASLIVSRREGIDYRALLKLVEEIESNPISRTRSELAGMTQWLAVSSRPEHRELATTLDLHYRNANLRLSVAGEFLERFLPNGQHQVRPVRQRILGADTRGNSRVETQLKLELIPDPYAWHVGINVLGDMLSNTKASKGPAVFHSTSTAHINSNRYLRISRQGYTISKERTNVATQDYLRKMSTDYDGLPIIGDFVRVLAREQFNQKRGLARRVSERLIAQETDQEVDKQLESSLQTAEKEFEQRLLGPLERLHLNPTVSSISTSEKRLTVRYRVASDMQMASHTPRPRAPTSSLMSLQFHESSLNNAIAQLGLSGKTWAIGDLVTHVGHIFQQTNWELPSDVPEDISIRFADTRPATVELKDGKLRLTLRIAELKQPSRNINIDRFLVHSTYVPIATGLEAELVRDGVVEIVSSRNRIPLRLIFAKVFVSNPQIPLISEQWLADERAEGLAVSQLDIRDGWLGLAIGSADSPQAAAVAERAQQIKYR